MKRRLLYCCLWAVLMVANSPFINAEDLTPEASALQKVLNTRVLASDATNDPKWRASLADALHRYCESVLVQVPRNTPQEDQWVENEIEDFSRDRQRFDERMKRVLNSVEYARKAMRRILSECSSITNSLMEPKQPSAREALRWVLVARLFMAENETWRLVKIIGLVSDCRQITSAIDWPDFIQKGLPPGSHDKNDICLTWDRIQYQILDQAVIPLLEAQ